MSYFKCLIFNVLSLTGDRLSAQAKIFKKFSILLNVSVTHVIKHPSATTNHHQQSTTGVMVLFVALEMLGETVDSLCEKRDLHFWRARVFLVLAVLADDVLCRGSRHIDFRLSKSHHLVRSQVAPTC